MPKDDDKRSHKDKGDGLRRMSDTEDSPSLRPHSLGSNHSSSSSSSINSPITPSLTSSSSPALQNGLSTFGLDGSELKLPSSASSSSSSSSSAHNNSGQSHSHNGAQESKSKRSRRGVNRVKIPAMLRHATD